MKRTDAQSLDSVIAEWIRENDLEKPLLEHRVVEQWDTILGPTIARYSRDISVKDGMLRVRITNAALRQELFEQRELDVTHLIKLCPEICWFYYHGLLSEE